MTLAGLCHHDRCCCPTHFHQSASNNHADWILINLSHGSCYMITTTISLYNQWQTPSRQLGNLKSRWCPICGFIFSRRYDFMVRVKVIICFQNVYIKETIFPSDQKPLTHIGASIHWATLYLVTRYHGPRDIGLQSFDRSEIRQVPREQGDQGHCQILERNCCFRVQSRRIKYSGNLAVKRRIPLCE